MFRPGELVDVAMKGCRRSDAGRQAGVAKAARVRERRGGQGVRGVGGSWGLLRFHRRMEMVSLDTPSYAPMGVVKVSVWVPLSLQRSAAGRTRPRPPVIRWRPPG